MINSESQFIVIDDAKDVLEETFWDIIDVASHKEVIQEFVDWVSKVLKDILQCSITQVSIPDNMLLFKWFWSWDTVVSLIPEGLISLSEIAEHVSITRWYESTKALARNNWYSFMDRNWWNIDLELSKLQWLSWEKLVIIDDWLNSWKAISKVLSAIQWKFKEVEIRVICNFSWMQELHWSPILQYEFFDPKSIIDVFEVRDIMLWLKYTGAVVKSKDKDSIIWTTYTRPEIAHWKSSIPVDMSKEYCIKIVTLYKRLIDKLELSSISLSHLNQLSWRVSLFGNTNSTFWEAIDKEILYLNSL